MTADIRIPSEEDRDQVLDLLRTSLNFPRDWTEARGPLLPLDDFRCGYVDGRVVAAAAAFSLRQWFGGRDLSMSGIYAVATLPEHRGTGLASDVVLQVLREARDGGASVSALYPAVLRPYRRIGYELGGTFSEHRLSLDAIPADLGDRLPLVELLDPGRDLAGVLRATANGCGMRTGRSADRRLVDPADLHAVRGRRRARGGGPGPRRRDRGVRGARS